jgi:hypothetical protein
MGKEMDTGILVYGPKQRKQMRYVFDELSSINLCAAKTRNHIVHKGIRD